MLKLNKKMQYVNDGPFEPINIDKLQPCDVLLFYHGNKLTEWHGRYRRKEFGRCTLPPYHTAIIVEPTHSSYLLLDPEITTGFSIIEEYTKKSSIRIDVIRYSLTGNQKRKIIDRAKEIGAREGVYDVKGYGAFIAQLPALGWVKYVIRPSSKGFFCSDAVTYLVQEVGGLRISKYDNNETAPIDMLLYACCFPPVGKLYTLKERGKVLE